MPSLPHRIVLSRTQRGSSRSQGCDLVPSGAGRFFSLRARTVKRAGATFFPISAKNVGGLAGAPCRQVSSRRVLLSRREGCPHASDTLAPSQIFAHPDLRWATAPHSGDLPAAAALP